MQRYRPKGGIVLTTVNCDCRAAEKGRIESPAGCRKSVAPNQKTHPKGAFFAAALLFLFVTDESDNGEYHFVGFSQGTER